MRNITLDEVSNILENFIEDPGGSLMYCVECHPQFWQEGEMCHCTWYSKIFVRLLMRSMMERKSKTTILHVQMILFPYQELLVYHPIECVFPKFQNLLKDNKNWHYYKCTA